MKLIHQSHEILAITEEPLKLLELAGRTCFHPSTEILTESGWKAVGSITETDRVLTHPCASGQLQYEKPNMVKKRFRGGLLESTHRAVKFSITPDHRVIACRPWKYRDYQFVEARELLRGSGWRVPKWFAGTRDLLPEHKPEIVFEDHHYQSAIPRTTKGRRFYLNDSFLFLVAAYLTEGHVVWPKGSGAGVCITQKVGSPLYHKLHLALLDLGMATVETLDPRKVGVAQIKVNGGRPVADWFAKNCGVGSKNKRLPAWFRNLSRRQKEFLKQAMYLGDGTNSESSGRQSRYQTASRRLADDMQELDILLGVNANMSEFTYEKYDSHAYFVETAKRDSWIVKPKHIKKVPYDGWVYCPSTESGRVCARFNGSALWIGNCYKSEGKICEGSDAKFAKMILGRHHESVIEHASLTVRFTTNRGVTHEDVRHRISSYSQESTRYCNYGGKDMQFIVPVWTEEGALLAAQENIMKENRYIRQATDMLLRSDSPIDVFVASCIIDEFAYNRLLALKWTPQQAREVLPNALKTEIVHTANFRSWRHILKERTSSAAHPQMRALMLPLLAELKQRVPVIFDDIAPTN